jgi:predicted ester cyclase
MSTETNKALMRRAIEEVYNQGKVALIDELGTPNYVHHMPPFPDFGSLEDYKRFFIAIRSAFPDLHITIEDLIAEGELVVLRYTWRGTNTGDFVLPTMRIPATGKQVTMMGITITRYAGGKAVEAWDLVDNLGFYQQLGLIPMPQAVG